jgi:transketolase
MAVEPFREKFPERFINVGVAEQNMIGVATGLAEAGFVPYAYSIATFASLRPFEFIRNGPVLHRLPVRVVGMGAGFAYGHAGPTHYALEDVAVLRTLPDLAIVVPADSQQAETSIRQTWDRPGPIYYSLAKDDAAPVPGLDGRFGLQRIQMPRQGRDIAIVAMGALVSEAVAAADQLSAHGIEAGLIVVSNFNPDPVEELADSLSEYRAAITVEAQTISGGLGALVASVIASRDLNCRLWPLAVRSSPDGTSGRQAERWSKHGLDRAAIVGAAQEALGAPAW